MLSSIEDAVRLLPEHPLLLAVSGGLDSMVLLDAVARLLPRDRLAVATFDHGTGEPARCAVAHVVAEAGRRGIPVSAGGGQPLRQTEAAWRTARWEFLRDVAESSGARIVTAHTASDQVETVVMRELRGTGVRGLAGLYAASDVLRPFVRLARPALAGYAALRQVEWIEDPSNASMRFTRNRLRRDVIPALSRVRPGIVGELLDLSDRAARWRREADAVVAECCPAQRGARGALVVAAADLVGYDPSSLAVLWPSIAGRVGLALDQPGTHRLVAFTRNSTAGAVMPLSGGWEVVRGAETLSLQRARGVPPGRQRLAANGEVQWGRWCFRPTDAPRGGDSWSAVLPSDRALAVRAWEPSDRVQAGTGLVRVKRVLAEAGIAAEDRAGWPVVVEDDAIVWIPGVSRVLAATARSGRPGVCIRCDPCDG